jgi:hypothetical protein
MTSQQFQNYITQLSIVAVSDWKCRHICLPSVIAAMILEEAGQEEVCEKQLLSVQAAAFTVHSYNDYLATWRGEGQREPNWKELIGESNYIRAVQYLQRAEFPYKRDRTYEAKLVGIIEKYQLMKYDEENGIYSYPKEEQ